MTSPCGLTIGGGAGLALEAERGSEASAVVEAPALLHFDWTGAVTVDLGAWGTPVYDGRLSALDALTTRTGHPYTVFKAQLLTKRQKTERYQEQEDESAWQTLRYDTVRSHVAPKLHTIHIY